jgi:hypothetical protein
MSKEIVQKMVASIEPKYINELNNKYTRYNNQTPKSLLAHLASNCCKTTVTDQLKAERKFEKPWDQVTNLVTWITCLEQLCQKCDNMGVSIDDGSMARSQKIAKSTRCSPMRTMKRTKIYQVTI